MHQIVRPQILIQKIIFHLFQLLCQLMVFYLFYVLGNKILFLFFKLLFSSFRVLHLPNSTNAAKRCSIKKMMNLDFLPFFSFWRRRLLLADCSQGFTIDEVHTTRTKSRTTRR